MRRLEPSAETVASFAASHFNFMETPLTRNKVLALVTTAAALTAGCSSTPVAPPAAPAAPAVTAAAAPRSPAAPTPSVARPAPAPAVVNVAVPPYLDPKSELSKGRSVYFDFDDYTVKKEFTTLIERHGAYLASNFKVAIRIEGNADERGRAEYNLALGQKRAESVRRALKLLGVPEAQMEAISWGEEKSRATGHDESAWAQNRRVDLQYPSR